MHLKLLQNNSFKKQQKQLVILLVTKMVIKLQKFQKTHKIIQRQFQMRMIKKYLKIYVSPELRQEIIDELRLK